MCPSIRVQLFYLSSRAGHAPTGGRAEPGVNERGGGLNGFRKHHYQSRNNRLIRIWVVAVVPLTLDPWRRGSTGLLSDGTVRGETFMTCGYHPQQPLMSDRCNVAEIVGSRVGNPAHGSLREE